MSPTGQILIPECSQLPPTLPGPTHPAWGACPSLLSTPLLPPGLCTHHAAPSPGELPCPYIISQFEWRFWQMLPLATSPGFGPHHPLSRHPLALYSTCHDSELQTCVYSFNNHCPEQTGGIRVCVTHLSANRTWQSSAHHHHHHHIQLPSIMDHVPHSRPSAVPTFSQSSQNLSEAASCLPILHMKTLRCSRGRPGHAPMGMSPQQLRGRAPLPNKLLHVYILNKEPTEQPKKVSGRKKLA